MGKFLKYLNVSALILTTKKIINNQGSFNPSAFQRLYNSVTAFPGY